MGSNANDYRKINIREVSPSMALAKSIEGEGGQIIIPKDTLITLADIRELERLGVTELFIKTADINDISPDDENINYSKEKIEVVSRPEFQRVNDAYIESTNELKSVLNDIGKGQKIDMNALYSLASNVMDKIKSKSEIFTYIGFLETFDEGTYAHSNNVALLCNVFGRWLGMSNSELEYLTVAGILHDIGKTQVNQTILNKPSKLTDEEFKEIKKHTILGYRILENQNIPNEIKLSALMHHEKIDGSGYPTGAKENQINQFAKIVAICDIYDAMTANRVYRKKILPFEVIKTFERNSYGQLDTKYLLVFIQNIAYNYIGSWVKLSNGMEGEIVFINKSNLSRPMVKLESGDVLDLSSNYDINITNLF
ncbi:MAG: HD-GYP domain-containing protein [Clostridiales bacterium]|nr:HD-GYP domain-containing protein [Clostridiales bacterium]